MINANNKTIYFGYGDVVLSDYLNAIGFTEIEPPVEVGSSVSVETTKQTATGPEITIAFNNIESFTDFKNAIKTINGKDCLQCNYNGYTLDFSNYNQKSIKVILDVLERISLFFILPMAC
jgi:hypothetical protein